MQSTHYYPPLSTQHQDLLSVFIEFLFSPLSSHEWEHVRKTYQQPVYRNEIAKIHNLLLENQRATALQTISGAYHQLDPFFENILLTYLACNAFGPSSHPSSNTLWFKISWDNRHLLGKNEAWSITPLFTTFPQSSLHVRDFCIAQVTERHDDMKPIFLEIKLDKFLRHFKRKTCLYQGKEHNLRYITSMDWMALVSELNLAYPNTKNLLAHVCWCCGINKLYLREGYLLDPFATFTPCLKIHNFPNALLPSVPLKNRRYDWMHMVNIVLSNTLKMLLKYIIPDPAFQRNFFDPLLEECLDKRIHSHPLTTQSSLTCNETKAFFAHNLHLNLPHIFNHPQTHKTSLYPNPNAKFTKYTFAEMLTLALDAIRYYQDFSYKQFPTKGEISHLQLARTRLLSLYAGEKWRQTPTLHFMVNEAIYFVSIDKTAYITLQEGAEHHNFDDMIQSSHTLQSALHSKSGESSWQSMLNKQLLILEAQKYNLAPSSHTILPGHVQTFFDNNKPLQPLLFAKIVEPDA